MGEALPALGRLDSPPARTRGSQPPCTISQPRRPARPAGRAGRPSLFGGCPGRLLLAVRPPKVPRVPLRADLPRAAHTHISAEHKSTRRSAQRRPGGTSSGRQPMHLIDEHPPEPRSKHGMDLIAVQAPLPPSEDALLRDCSVTVIVAGAGLGSLRCGRGCGSRATWGYSLSTARGGGQQLAQREYGPEAAF